jgi:hypothetical protein
VHLGLMNDDKTWRSPHDTGAGGLPSYINLWLI